MSAMARVAGRPRAKFLAKALKVGWIGRDGDGRAVVTVAPTAAEAGTWEAVMGYVGEPGCERWAYSASEGTDALEQAVLESPDDALIQVPPAWVGWAKEWLGVQCEWATTWYAMARVNGVHSRLVGPAPAGIHGEAITAATGGGMGKGAQGEEVSGVVAVRGWARGRKLQGGKQEGRRTALFKYCLNALGRSTKAQYLFVATHKEGRKAVRTAVAAAGGHVMMKVPEGRMGHREAYWPMDRRRGEHKDWAGRKRRPANPEAEEVWLVAVGGPVTISGEREGGQYRKARRAAEVALEQLGMEQVAGGLRGITMKWKTQGTARILGCDEEHLWQAFRWLGMSVDTMARARTKQPSGSRRRGCRVRRCSR
jgi:hypothetical protein